MCVQKNAWHPPEGKCHILRRRRGTRALDRVGKHLLKGSFWVKDLDTLTRTIEK